ncbi:MAG TPA: O-antigen ligase family protein [Candidatus Binataceae bacterium]|nr:O-antigen ligase family protein [Candidatus Binataceae bacterium]
MTALSLEFRPWAGERRPPASTRTLLLVAAMGIWALAVMLFAPAAIGTVALSAAGVLVLFASLAYRRSEWRVFALLLVVEALPSANFLPLTEAERPLLRYPLYLLFCVPMLPRVWRSGILSRGGFRLYSLYFAWAFLSATWSLVPMFSFGRALSSTLLFVALCSIALDVEDNDSLKRMIRYVLAACAILTTIIAITALIPLPSAWMLDRELDAYRLQGIFDSPNQVGEVNMITIGAALACWRSLRASSQKIGTAVLIVVSALMMVAADSRSAAVAMILGMAALAIYRYGRRGFLAVIAAAALAVMVAGQMRPQALLYLTRSDVTTLTGRTEVMQFSLHRLMEDPLVGFGFGAEGQIFQNRYFPSWDDLWTWGPRIPIHNSYLSRAVGVGVPAACLWLFLFLRPLIALFGRPADRFGLRTPVVLLLVLPVLILYLSETLGGDCRYPAGIVSTLVWAVAEKQRLRADGKRLVPGIYPNPLLSSLPEQAS